MTMNYRLDRDAERFDRERREFEAKELEVVAITRSSVPAEKRGSGRLW